MKNLVLNFFITLFFCATVCALDFNTLPSLQARRAKVSFFLKAPLPIVELDSMSTQQELGYRLAIKDPRFIEYAKDGNGAPYLSEIFGIYPAKPGDINESIDLDGIMRVEMYNFALNLATVAIVDTRNQRVASVSHYPDSQPDIPQYLKEIAIDIATNAPQVLAALGEKPASRDALMASTKTALNRTRCERSRHLCVAPTFVKEDKALWVIVDLTDLDVAGIRWTNVGSTGPSLITEKHVQNESITDDFCEKESLLSRDQWSIKYHLTSSDGLEINSVAFKGVPILDSVKLVDWHVRYSHTDGFGYSDAIGCPVFSQAAVVANQPPQIKEFSGPLGSGFAIEQMYFNQDWPRPCNYNYIQRYEFFSDGKFRISAASIGRGCGNDGTYIPVFRIAFSDTKFFSEFADNAWKEWEHEGWRLQSDTSPYTEQGFQFRIGTKHATYNLEPGRGQFNDGGRGDFAYTYVTTRKPEEGESNLITIGPCCNIDHRQGPEKFMESPPESLASKEFVLWYAPQLRNDDRVGHEYCWAESILVDGVYEARTYPCFAGPMFVPQ